MRLRSPRRVIRPLASVRSREDAGDGNVVRSPGVETSHHPDDRSVGFQRSHLMKNRVSFEFLFLPTSVLVFQVSTGRDLFGDADGTAHQAASGWN